MPPEVPDAGTPVLRPLRIEDASDVLEAFRSAPDMARQGAVTTLEEAEAYIRRLTGSEETNRAFAVVHAGRVVAVIGLSLDRLNRNGWMFYWAAASARGRGWTSRAALTVADRALDVDGVGCERLELGHRVDNPASGGVARAAGFVQEGRERGKFLIDGQRVDVLTYGRLRSDPGGPADLPRLPWQDGQ